MITTQCRGCGKPFNAQRPTARYCSGACRAAHSRRDRAERQRRAVVSLVFDTRRVLLARGVAEAAADVVAIGACDEELAAIDRRTVDLFGVSAVAA